MTGGSIATGAGTLTVNGNITTNASATSATISGQLNLGGATRTLDVADGEAAIDLDISAAISNGGITKTGAGTLQLSGAAILAGRSKSMPARSSRTAAARSATHPM